MNPRNRMMNMVVLGSVAGLVALAGCSDSSQPPVATVAPTSAATSLPITSPTNTSAASPGAATVTATSEGVSGSASPTVVGGGRIDPQATVDRTSCAKINLNEATEAQLMEGIPGFSSRMVREFFEYRPYASIQEFRLEIGKYVDAAQVAEYEKYVYVPVDPNTADADTLKQLPGVDDAIAATLIAGRPYASNQDFVGTLAAHADEQTVVRAGCYLATP